MGTMKAVFRNGLIETEEPLNLSEGTEWMISLPNDTPDAPMSPEVIAGVHTTTRRFAEIDFIT
ncbi:MAG: hypothetical protein K2V38_24065, partial [Gemmataceae bacterium]|nr:hypothetical protein [Gemmataceae bacterium]